MAERHTIIHVTPSLADKGGIASVVSTYSESTLASRYRLVVCETVRGSGIGRVARGGIGVLRAAARVLGTRGCLVHVHMSSGGSFWRKTVVLWVARLAGRRSILHLHGSRFHAWAEGGSRLRAMAVRRVFGWPDAVIVLSESWRDRVCGFSGRCDGMVVPNPVIVPKEPSQAVGTRSVVFLGRLGERKGVYELVGAIGRLREQGVVAKWTIAGDGEVEHVRQLVESRGLSETIAVPGWVGRQEVAELLRTHGVFCLPSKDEGLPIALLESMASGLACVVTPVGGIPELVEDGVNGLLVLPGDVSQLAHVLGRVLEDGAMAARLGAQARSDVRSRYAVDRVVEVLSELYGQLECVAAPVARDSEER